MFWQVQNTVAGSVKLKRHVTDMILYTIPRPELEELLQQPVKMKAEIQAAYAEIQRKKKKKAVKSTTKPPAAKKK